LKLRSNKSLFASFSSEIEESSFSEEKEAKRLLLSSGLALALCLSAGAGRAEECPPAGDMPVPVLPHTRAALATNQPLIVVALGSSSTRGWMATNIAHSYPALLQRELNDAVPKADFAIINRGIGGQDAPEELARLDTDVLAVRPQLVIWQVGANGAVHDEPPELFKHLVEEGIAKLKAAGSDVILMDNQRSPRILSAPEHTVMDNALREVAAETRTNLFSRGGLMDHWAASGAPYEDFIAVDGFHMNNRGYACLAKALADVIAAALRQPIGQQVGKTPR
jgi:lysophospholipase L1-like esterase